jgi:hypothetical protein
MDYFLTSCTWSCYTDFSWPSFFLFPLRPRCKTAFQKPQSSSMFPPTFTRTFPSPCRDNARARQSFPKGKSTEHAFAESTQMCSQESGTLCRLPSAHFVPRSHYLPNRTPSHSLLQVCNAFSFLVPPPSILALRTSFLLILDCFPFFLLSYFFLSLFIPFVVPC